MSLLSVENLHTHFITRDLDNRGVQFELDLRDRGVAHFDEEKILRVLHNLARNAAEAIGESGGTCRLIVDRNEEGAVVIFVDRIPVFAQERAP